MKRLTLFAFGYDAWNFDPENFGFQYWPMHYLIIGEQMKLCEWTKSTNFLWLVLDVHLRLALKFDKLESFGLFRNTWLHFLQKLRHSAEFDQSKLQTLSNFCQEYSVQDEEILNALICDMHHKI